MHPLQPLIHYGLHFVFPAFWAYYYFKPKWQRVYYTLLATMLVDADHLLATPIFDSNRPSIPNHLLHSYPAIFVYAFCIFIPKLRLIAFGLLLHMCTDFLDSLWMQI